MRPNIGKYFYLSRAGDAFFFAGTKKQSNICCSVLSTLKGLKKKTQLNVVPFFIPCEAVGLGV